MIELDQTFRQYHTFVWRILRGLGAPWAEDGVQEVFIVMHRRRHGLDTTHGVQPLLYGIARRVASRQRDQARRTPPPLTLVPRESPDPETHTHLQERAAVVRAALSTINDDKRTMFLLADVEGMRIPEIARTQGININAAYARLRSAREVIRRAVARHRITEEPRRVRSTR